MIKLAHLGLGAISIQKQSRHFVLSFHMHRINHTALHEDMQDLHIQSINYCNLVSVNHNPMTIVVCVGGNSE